MPSTKDSARYAQVSKGKTPTISPNGGKTDRQIVISDARFDAHN